MSPKSESGYVYLILYPNNQYKIGRSKKPWQRLKQLQGTSPARIYHVCSIFTHDAIALEKQLHHKYYSVRDDRTEFFNLSDEQVSDIIKLNQEIP